MKKTALFLSLCLFLLPLPVLAGPQEDYDGALEQTVSQAELEYSLSCKTAEPPAEAVYDYLPSDWLNGSLQVSVRYASPSPDKLKLAALMTLTGSTGSASVYHTWIDLDKTAKKLLYIMQPEADKPYGYYDLSGDSDENAELIQAFSPADYFDAAKFTAALSRLNAQIKAQQAPAFKDGVYTTVLPADKGKEALKALSTEMMSLFSEMLFGQTATEEIRTALQTKLTGQMAALGDAPLLQKDSALKATLCLNDKKQPQSMRYEVNFDTDIKDLAKAITPAKQPADSAKLKATVVLDAAFRSFNEPKEIPFPALTEKNSINLAQPPVQEDKPVELRPGLNILIQNKPFLAKAEPYIENGRTMAPGQALCAALPLPYTYQDGTLTITKGDKTLAFTADSASCSLNGQTTALEVQTRVVMEELFVPVRFLAETFGYQVGFEQKLAADGKSVFASIVLIDPAKAKLSVAVPENPALTQALKIAEALSDTEVELRKLTKPEEQNRLMLAAGEPIILYEAKNESSYIEEFAPVLVDLAPLLERFAPNTKALLDKDEAVRAAVTDKNGAILAFPVKNGSQLELFYLSSTLENKEAAVSCLNAYSEVVKALTEKKK